jgi:hypothetical protein
MERRVHIERPDGEIRMSTSFLDVKGKNGEIVYKIEILSLLYDTYLLKTFFHLCILVL